jgi:hypothetical protein
MAEKVQINPLITPETRELLKRMCHERSCSQGDIVEAALVAHLTRSEDSVKLDTLIAQLLEMQGVQETVQQKLASLEAVTSELLTLLTEHLAPSQRPPIATYAQMYGGMVHTKVVEDDPPPQVVPRRPFPLRWFWREGTQ